MPMFFSASVFFFETVRIDCFDNEPDHTSCPESAITFHVGNVSMLTKFSEGHVMGKPWNSNYNQFVKSHGDPNFFWGGDRIREVRCVFVCVYGGYYDDAQDRTPRCLSSYLCISSVAQARAHGMPLCFMHNSYFFSMSLSQRKFSSVPFLIADFACVCRVHTHIYVCVMCIHEVPDDAMGFQFLHSDQSVFPCCPGDMRVTSKTKTKLRTKTQAKTIRSAFTSWQPHYIRLPDLTTLDVHPHAVVA